MASFEKVKASVPIERAAKLLGLELHQEKNQLRGRCPACNTGDNRMLAITPSKGVGVFYCRVADKGGSCIDLVAHITGMSLPEAAEWLADTLPQAEDPEIRSSERGTAAHSPPKAQPASFDPEVYLEKLQYNENIQALGLSEEEAKDLGVGWSTAGFHKNTVVCALRWPSGEIAAFISATDLKFPKTLVPPKVVKLKRA